MIIGIVATVLLGDKLIKKIAAKAYLVRNGTYKEKRKVTLMTFATFIFEIMFEVYFVFKFFQSLIT